MGGPPGQGNQTSETRAQMLEKMKAMSTGEEIVVIPIGIQMLKSGDNTAGEKAEMVEASLKDMTADKMVTIWVDGNVKDKKVASFVLIGN
jgi:hypothetical protein